MAITADCFPTPDLALRSADPVQEQRVRRFAAEQAVIAETMRVRLAEELPSIREHDDRVELLRTIYFDLMEWRYRLALATARRLGRGLPFDPERFRLPIHQAGANYDRLGLSGRLRIGSTWNPATRTFEDGQPTPASEIMEAYGKAALARFDAEQDNLPDPDVLINPVTLPPTHRAGGNQIADDNQVVNGNRLLRGLAAKRAADELLARVRARGGDTSQVEVGGAPIYAVTADHQNAHRIFTAALDLLAETLTHTYDPLLAWQTTRYLLYQAPVMKRAATR